MRIWLTIFIAVLGLLIVSCGEDDNIDDFVVVSYEQPFTLRVGQTGMSLDSATVKLVEIPTDSRCATNATCIWEGEIVVQLEGTHGGVTIPLEISQSLGQIEAATANFVRFQLELVEANPYPDLNKNNGLIDQDDYRLTFILRGQP